MMSTDLHTGPGADPATLDPNTLPDPDGGNLLPVPRPPYGPADTAVLPVQTTEPPAPDPANPPAPETPIRAFECVTGPLATIADLMGWLATAADRNGAPTSVTMTSSVREAQLNFLDAPAFLAWARWYGITELRYPSDVLGESAEATTTINGWVLNMRLSGSAVEELS